MKKIISIVLIMICISVILGCGGGEIKKEPEKTNVAKKDTPAKETPAPEQPKPEVKKDEEPVKEVPKSSLILVFGTNSNIEAKDKEIILKAVKEKFLKDKEYAVVDLEVYKKDIKPYLGKNVVKIESRLEYGELELTVDAAKLEIHDGDVVEAPWEEFPEYDAIRGRSSMEDLLKEIKFLSPRK